MTWVRPHVCYKALVALTPATVGLSFPRMGTAWHLAVGLAFGTVNAALVGIVFVNLMRGQAWTGPAAGVGLVWLGILMTLIMTDYAASPAASF